MADVWQFSPSSLELLNRCLSVDTKYCETETKWKQLFGKDQTEEEKAAEVHEEKMEDDSNNIESTRARIETAPASEGFVILEEVCENNNLLPAIMEKLSAACTEKILDDLFNDVRTDTVFVDKFLQQFFTVSNMKRYSINVISDLLTKAHKAYPELLLPLVESKLMDADVPSNILKGFLEAADVNHSEILQALSLSKMSSQAFVTHMNPLCILYKNSDKSCEIQNFILDCLTRSSRKCTRDVTYGSFLLVFMESLKIANTPVDKQFLGKLLNTHETSYKQLCLEICQDLTGG